MIRKLFGNFACAISLEPNLFIPCCGTHHRPYGSCKKTFLLGPPNTGFLRTLGGGGSSGPAGKGAGWTSWGASRLAARPGRNHQKGSPAGLEFSVKIKFAGKMQKPPKIPFLTVSPKIYGALRQSFFWFKAKRQCSIKNAKETTENTHFSLPVARAWPRTTTPAPLHRGPPPPPAAHR